MVVGWPTRWLIWIMSREQNMKAETYDMIIKKAQEEWGYDTSIITRVPQNWD